MSSLSERDADLHHEDGSHRWGGGDPGDQAAWEDRIRAHVEEHQAELRTPRSAATR